MKNKTRKGSWTLQPDQIRKVIAYLERHPDASARTIEAATGVGFPKTRIVWHWISMALGSRRHLAWRLGNPKDYLIRAEAGVAHVLQELSGEGHCACAVDTLLTTTEKLLKICQPILIEAI
jgi:exodeoxyribonuclease V alpha subunit